MKDIPVEDLISLINKWRSSGSENAEVDLRKLIDTKQKEEITLLENEIYKDYSRRITSSSLISFLAITTGMVLLLYFVLRSENLLSAKMLLPIILPTTFIWFSIKRWQYKFEYKLPLIAIYVGLGLILLGTLGNEMFSAIYKATGDGGLKLAGAGVIGVIISAYRKNWEIGAFSFLAVALGLAIFSFYIGKPESIGPLDYLQSVSYVFGMSTLGAGAAVFFLGKYDL